MSKYRARQCPNCHYFVGFAVAKSFVRGVTASLTNFCLNCNYKLPVHTIVRGNGAVKRRSRRPKLRLIVGASDSVTLIGVDKRQSYTMETKISPADYARHLRAIGQDLENLHLSTFNLEYVGDAYLVWVIGQRGRRQSGFSHQQKSFAEVMAKQDAAATHRSRGTGPSITIGERQKTSLLCARA